MLGFLGLRTAKTHSLNDYLSCFPVKISQCLQNKMNLHLLDIKNLSRIKLILTLLVNIIFLLFLSLNVYP